MASNLAGLSIPQESAAMRLANRVMATAIRRRKEVAMSDPAFYDLSATEATAAKIQEKTEVASAKVLETAEAKVRETADTTVRAARQLKDRLQDGWQQMSDCVTETRARIPVFKQELREDAAYIAERARYYHEERPLHTLGIIAAAAFVLGIAIGLGRR